MFLPDENYFSHSRPEVAALLPPSSQHVLEIGCGAGRFSGHVRDRKSYWGVEPSAEAAQLARAKLDTVLHGTFDHVRSQLPERHFDLVVCNDVIEHMPDHDLFFEAIKTKMAPGASMVGSVPNVRYLPHLCDLVLRRDWKYTEEGVLDRTHLRFFTTQSLQRTVLQHGYRIEKLVGLNSVIANSRWLGKARWWGTLMCYQLATMRGQGDSQFLQMGFRLHFPG